MKQTISGLKQQILEESNIKLSIQPTQRANKIFSSGNQYPKTTPGKSLGDIKIATRINEVILDGRDTINDVYTPYLDDKAKRKRDTSRKLRKPQGRYCLTFVTTEARYLE